MGESRIIGGGGMKHKFRAWDRATNQMRGCYGFNDMEQEVYVCSVADNEFNGRPKTVHALKRSFDEVVIMQSTGLEDADYVEIFEGDYLSWISFESQKELKGEVVFYKGSFCIVVRIKRHDYKVPLHDLSNLDNLLKVLGNIYEHPELLEEGEMNEYERLDALYQRDQGVDVPYPETDKNIGYKQPSDRLVEQRENKVGLTKLEVITYLNDILPPDIQMNISMHYLVTDVHEFEIKLDGVVKK